MWQTGLHNPDFAAYARLCGAHGTRATRSDELDTALTAALAHPGPALVDVVTDPRSPSERSRCRWPRRARAPPPSGRPSC
ncbi:MAG: thiamine pyrophosphate-dependent enzyme [Acidimicrobiales bacterium]